MPVRGKSQRINRNLPFNPYFWMRKKTTTCMMHTYLSAMLRSWAKGTMTALGLALLAPALAMAQVTTYSFSQSQGTYTPITPDQTYGDQNTDDNNYNAIDIGFSFRYNGIDYTTVSIHNNGMLVLGSDNNWSYTAAASDGGTAEGSALLMSATPPTGSNSNVIAGLVCDLQTQNTAPLGVLRSGNPGSRRFTVQWNDQKRYGAHGDGDHVNFQIVLKEGTNAIDIIFGDITAGTTVDTKVQVGLRGNSTTDINHLVGTSLTSVSRTSGTTDRINAFTGAAPQPGLTFTYTPIPPAPNDLSLAAIIAPRPDQTTCLLSNQEPVRVVVRNFGTAPQTSTPISYRVNGGPVITQTFTFNPSPLAPGATDTLTFSGANGANLSTANTYSFTAYTSLATEVGASRSNDTLKGYTVTLTGPITPPATAFGSLSELISGKWNKAKGQSPLGTTSDWNTGFPFATESVAIIMQGTGTTTRNQQEWLLSPSYNVNANTFLIFKAAITLTEFGSTAVTSIGDDTLRVAYSTDCGTTWRTLTRFTNADLLSGRIDNSLKEFRVGVNTLGSPIRIGFFATNNNTQTDPTYRFHLDDIQFKDLVANDLGVTQVLGPVAGTPGCLLSTQEPVSIVIKNYGTATQTQVTAKYTLFNGTTPGTLKTQSFTLRRPLVPGNADTLVFTGANGADLSSAGRYTVLAYTDITGETAQTHLNDTTKSAAIQISNPLSLPAPIVASVADLTANGWGKGRGLTTPTGTASDWGFSNLSGNPVVGLTVDTARNKVQREWIYSPSYQGSAATFLVFKAAVIAPGNGDPAPNGMEDDTLNVYVSNDCGGTWRRLVKFSNRDVQNGGLTNVLTEYSYRLSTTSQRLQVAFQFNNNSTSATGVRYRVVLDDIIIRDAASNDAGVTGSLAPRNSVFGCAPGNVNPIVIVRNYGADPISSLPVSYTVNGGTPVSQTFTLTPPLQPGAVDTLTFSTPANLTTGSYVIQFKTALPGETSTTVANDTLRRFTVTYNSVVSALNGYSENFDGYTPGQQLPPSWNASGAATADFYMRQVILPNLQTTFLLRSAYNNLVNYRWGSTPQMQLPTDSSRAKLTFDMRVTEAGRGTGTVFGASDSVNIEISTNCGQAWTKIKSFTSANWTASSSLTRFTVPVKDYAGQTVSLRFSARMRRTDPQGCYVDIDNLLIDDPTAVKSTLSTKLAVFPNPSEGRIVVQRAREGQAAMTIVDGLGRVVTTSTLTARSQELDLSHLPKGIYSVVVRDAQGTTRTRLVLE